MKVYTVHKDGRPAGSKMFGGDSNETYFRGAQLKKRPFDFGENCLLALEGHSDWYINELTFTVGARRDAGMTVISKWEEKKRKVERLNGDFTAATKKLE